jgi:hypothetical protein
VVLATRSSTDSVRSGTMSSVHDTLDYDESSKNNSNKEMDLQVAYNKLFKECTKLKQLNILNFKKLNDDEHKSEFDC